MKKEAKLTDTMEESGPRTGGGGEYRGGGDWGKKNKKSRK